MRHFTFFVLLLSKSLRLVCVLHSLHISVGASPLLSTLSKPHVSVATVLGGAGPEGAYSEAGGRALPPHL